MSAVQGRQTAERYGIKVKQNMGKKVVTFGEIMLRLAPEGYYRFVQAESFGATYGGGEANVAVSLANFGFDACFVTKLPIGCCRGRFASGVSASDYQNVVF